MEDTLLKCGTLLYHENYRIEKVIGKGGFGITYLATDLSLNRKIAIKEFFPSAFCGRNEDTNNISCSLPTNKEMFQNLKDKFIKEAKNIAKLIHPNIIKIYSQFEENNTAYYAMEYIEGESINEKVKSDGPLSIRSATSYIEKIGNAVEYLHKNHMAHLDIKPANIMIRRSDNSPILIDFGLSKNYDKTGLQTTTTGTMGISPGFSPVEQYALKGVNEFSPKTDIYSLGATFYFMITGMVPPEPMSIESEGLSYPSFIPPNIQKAINKAMSYHRDNRHESVDSFLKQINGADSVEETQINIDKESTMVVDSESSNEATRIAEDYKRKEDERKRLEEEKRKKEEEQRLLQEKLKILEEEKRQAEARKQQEKIRNRNIGIGIALALIVILLILIFSGVFSNDSMKVETSYLATEATSGEVEAVDVAIPEATVSAEDSKNDDKSSREVVESSSSPYGPFDSRSAVENYIEDYYRTIEEDFTNTSNYNSKVTFDFGYGPTAMTPSEIVKSSISRREKNGYLYGSHDVDLSSMKITPLSDGGVQVKYSQYYTSVSEAKGEQNFLMHTNVKINKNRKIYYYQETTTKL